MLLGHVKRLLQGIGELTELVKNLPDSAAVQPPPAHALPELISVEEPILPPPDNWTAAGSSDRVDFAQIKGVEIHQPEEGVAKALPPPPIPTQCIERSYSPDLPPQLPPKKSAHIRKQMVGEGMLMYIQNLA